MNSTKEMLSRFQANLFTPEDSVLMAFSGGADSTACLTLLRELFPKMNLGAFYLDHGLRSEAHEERVFCEGYCRQLGVTFYQDRVDVRVLSHETKQSLEQAGRTARYEKLLDLAIRVHASKIVTAHHLGDQTESLLMQFLAGASGLNMGIQTQMDVGQGVYVIRPMLRVPKQTIYDYLEERHISYRVDHSNESTDFVRNKVRLILLPMIRQLVNPSPENALSRFKQLSDECSSFVSDYVKRVLEACQIGEKTYSVKRMRKEHLFIQKECLKVMILSQGSKAIRVTSAILEQMIQVLHTRKAHSQCQIFPALNWVKCYDEIGLEKRLEGVAKNDQPQSLKMGKNSLVSGALILKQSKDKRLHRGNPMSVRVDLDKIDLDSLCVRHRRIADRFIPLGMSEQKKLKDFLIDRKIPLKTRDAIWIVSDKNNMIWVVGWQIDDRVKITPETSRVLEMRVEGGNFGV